MEESKERSLFQDLDGIIADIYGDSSDEFVCFVAEYLGQCAVSLVKEFLSTRAELPEEDFLPLESLAWDGGCDDPECDCKGE